MRILWCTELDEPSALTGVAVGSIPESLGQLRGLKELYLDHNDLYGAIPNSIGESWKLVILHLEYNSLSGTCDGWRVQCDAPKCALTSSLCAGNLPQGLGQMRFLQQFYFSHNLIGGAHSLSSLLR